MTALDPCDRCGHVRSSHQSYAEGGCGSRVRIAKRVKICGCNEFREAVGFPVGLQQDRRSQSFDPAAEQLSAGLA